MKEKTSLWIAEYMSSKIELSARGIFYARKKAAMLLGVPKSREKHIRLCKGTLTHAQE